MTERASAKMHAPKSRVYGKARPGDIMLFQSAHSLTHSQEGDVSRFELYQSKSTASQ